jgi:murein DD-endopeptidase MepM/ murein hydrolase activator NlpD
VVGIVFSGKGRRTALRPLGDGARLHRAGAPVAPRWPRRVLMAGALMFSGLAGAATLALGLAGPPSQSGAATAAAPTDHAPASARASEFAELPGSDRQSSLALLSSPWEGASLGVDSDAHSPLLHEPYTVSLEVDRGDTLMSMLTGAGVDRVTAYGAIDALSDVFDPRGLRPRQSLRLTMLPPIPTDRASVQTMTFSPDPLRDIVVAPFEDGFRAEESTRAVEEFQMRADGRIQSSLYVAAMESGVPPSVLGDLIHIFSFDVDFQREIQPGDTFSLLFSEKRTESGETVGHGDILLAEMTVNGKFRRFYRFTDETGIPDYYDSQGRSVRRALLRTPVDGARISSGFGNRVHPILGYTRLHKGMDFAAPTGTPIYAAGDGVIEEAGWKGSFGKYVRIRHNGTYSTAYAHLHRIDSRMKPGARVRQRQVIGYVGSTGRSTGPHLHYEVHVNGKAVNPLGVKLPTGKELAGAELARFERLRSEIENQYAAAQSHTQVATVPD